MILSEPSIGIESLIIAAATFEREYRYGIIYSISSIIVICDFITKNNKLHNKRELICIYQGSFFLSVNYVCVSITRQRPSEKVIQLNLLAVRKRCRRSGVGKFLLEVS